MRAAAIRPLFQPASRVGPEKPKPGSEGTTTSKASSALPPWATGSVSGPITSRNSTIEPGQPWMRSSGVAFFSADLTWMKWNVWPSISVVNCGWRLIAASWARQS